MLTAQDLTVNGLAPFDLTIEAGECVALTGASGSGKTLVLRALADLDPGAGEVTLDGHSRTAIAAPDWRRRVVYLAAEPGWWADRVAAPDLFALVFPVLITLSFLRIISTYCP